MKKIYFYVIILTALLAFSPSVSLAKDAPSLIAVVDFNRVMGESSAVKNITKQIEEMRGKYQKEAAKEEDVLRKEEKELSEQRAVLSKDAFEKKANDFKTKALDAQKKFQTRYTRMENAHGKAIGKVKSTMLDIVAEMAKEKEFQVAMPRENLLYGAEALDISSDVLKSLNKRLSKVDVIIEEEKEEKKKK